MPQKDAVKKDHVKTGALKKDETMWATFCHLGGLFGFIFPFGNIVVPILIWGILKDENPFVDDQGKEVVNFQISLTLYLIASAFLILVLIGFAALIGLFIFSLVVTVRGAIEASKGHRYRYPLTIRFIQ